jgi:hypothetical protein
MSCGADPDLIKFTEFIIDRHDPRVEDYATVKEFGQGLLDNSRGVVGQPPLNRDGEFVFLSCAPYLTYKSIVTCLAAHRPEILVKGPY